MEQLSLSLINRVIFVDWNGVLSGSPFWESIQNASQKGILHGALAVKLDEIFARDCRLGDAWMRGEQTTSDLFASVRYLQGTHRRQDFLERRLIDDCLRMAVDASLFVALGHAKLRAPVVLATDNTEDFAKAFERAKSNKSWIRRRHAPATRHTLADVAQHLFDIICSARVGVLKAEDPHRFFGVWLASHGLTFNEALLVDDRSDNLEAFRRAGGSALQWHGADRAAEVVPAVLKWAKEGTASDAPEHSDRR